MERLVLSVMGPHAGESPGTIFSRKMRDIEEMGQTFWLVRSPGVRPDLVRRFFVGPKDPVVLFLAPASRNGARPTTSAESATELSFDRREWTRLPTGLSPVTGRMPAYALVLGHLSLKPPEPQIDLSSVVLAENGEPVRFRLGASSVIAEKVELPTTGMTSRLRQIVAVGHLTPPYAVWVR